MWCRKLETIFLKNTLSESHLTKQSQAQQNSWRTESTENQRMQNKNKREQEQIEKLTIQ